MATLFCMLATPVSAGANELRQPLPVTEVAPGVFVFQGAHQLFTPKNEGAICNIGFIIGDDAVAVIDTGGSLIQGERLKASIRLRTSLPVRYVINTHMHPDHIFGNPAFVSPETTFVGHAKLPRALDAREQTYLAANARLLGDAAKGLEVVRPTQLVERETKLDIGGRVLVLQPYPTAHTDNDLTVFDEKTSTFFAGDLLFSGHLPAIDGSVKGWLRVMDKLAERTDARVVPGHGPASMALQDALTPQKRYLTRLTNDIASAIKAGTSMQAAAKTAGLSEKDAWELFDEFNARNVAAAYAEMEWDD